MIDEETIDLASVRVQQEKIKILEGYGCVCIIDGEKIGKNSKYQKYLIKEMKGPSDTDKFFWFGTLTLFFQKDDEQQEKIKQNASLYLLIPHRYEVCHTFIKTVMCVDQFKIGNYYEIGFCAIAEEE